MNRWILALVAGVALGFAAGARADEGGAHRLGVGAHYWQTIDNLKGHDIDKDGFSWLASYQYRPGILGLGLDVEWKDKGFAGSTKDVYEPQAYLILGHTLYAAAGIGGYYTDGEFAEDPFYFLRAGFDFDILPSIYLDIHALYRFEEWGDLENSNTDIDTDTITLGAAIRIAL